jgi:hypothetical protein
VEVRQDAEVPRHRREVAERRGVAAVDVLACRGPVARVDELDHFCGSYRRRRSRGGRSARLLAAARGEREEAREHEAEEGRRKASLHLVPAEVEESGRKPLRAHLTAKPGTSETGDL